MKRLISVALALVMVLVAFTACGEVIKPAVGTYADGTGTSIIEVGAYDEKAESGTMKISNTLSDLVYEGTYTISENEPKVSSILTLTTTAGEEMSFVYDITLDVMQDINSCIAYYGPNYVEAGEPAAE